MRRNHARAPELWIKVHKKGSDLASVTTAEALDVMLCWGWIDGLRKGFDEQSFLQRYSPRRARSLWSQINRDHVARLIEAGRMTPHGQKQIDAAKADGRWKAAYAPIRGTSAESMPPDLRKAIHANARGAKKFGTLGRMNLFALGFRTNNMKTPAGRAKKIADIGGDAGARGDHRPREERAYSAPRKALKSPKPRQNCPVARTYRTSPTQKRELRRHTALRFDRTCRQGMAPQERRHSSEQRSPSVQTSVRAPEGVAHAGQHRHHAAADHRVRFRRRAGGDRKSHRRKRRRHPRAAAQRGDGAQRARCPADHCAARVDGPRQARGDVGRGAGRTGRVRSRGPGARGRGLARSRPRAMRMPGRAGTRARQVSRRNRSRLRASCPASSPNTRTAPTRSCRPAAFAASCSRDIRDC